MQSLFKRGLAASALWLTIAGIAVAQGTRADYERANRLREATQNQVFKTKVEPHWQPDNARFWYRNDLPSGGREFIVVDALAGSRRPAFDHARLAEPLAKATGQPADPARLPVDDLRWDDAPALRLQSRGRWFRYDAAANTLTEEAADKKEAAAAASLPVLAAPHPSNRTGPETVIAFVNRTRNAAEIYWIDTEGDKQRYASVAPGERHEQHTYAGHVWAAFDGDGKLLAAFEADETSRDAVIGGDPVSASAPRPPRRPRRGGRSSATSPDGHWQAFVKNQNVWLRDLQTRQESALSADGLEKDGYDGQVYWSPDSRKLAATRTQAGDDRKVYLIESSPKDQLQPKLDSYDYLKPGDKIPLSRPHLFDVGAGKQIEIKQELFPNPWSVSDVRWARDSSGFSFLYNQRGHQVLRIVGVDANSGEARAIVDEQSKTFIDYSGKLFSQYLDDTGEILWMSERDGWNHLYLYDSNTGQVKNQITKGEWVVRGVDRVDAERRQIWFRAGGIRPEQDPYYIHYCRVNFDGSGLTILTEGNGTHAVNFSPDGRFYVDSWSRVDMPPVTELRRSEDGKLVCELERADASALSRTDWSAPERFTAKGRDGATDICGVIFRPSHYDAAKKYPVVENIYAGPQDSFAPVAFTAFQGSQELAEIGFIVVQIDGMGTSNRSKKFHDVCWKNIADAGFPDRILWMQAAAAKYPAMDLSRVGVYGGSAGGQNALGALLTHGDFYKAAVADCGCHDNRMDKIWWNELWMSWPVGPEYAAQSNVTMAHKLRGNLMLVVGELDKNVDPASTMQVVNALIKADKDFDLLVVPGAGHGAGSSPYGKRRRADFFVRHLLGAEPRG